MKRCRRSGRCGRRAIERALIAIARYPMAALSLGVMGANAVDHWDLWLRLCQQMAEGVWKFLSLSARKAALGRAFKPLALGSTPGLAHGVLASGRQSNAMSRSDLQNVGVADIEHSRISRQSVSAPNRG